MEPVTGGQIAKIFDQLFSSFLKSLEGLFSSDAKIEEKFDKGKYIVRKEDKPESPVLDENGKPLGDNKAVFELTIAVQWPKEDKLTRDQAAEFAKKKETWNKAKTLSIEMTFAGKNRIYKTNLTADRVEKEIEDYKQEYDIMNKSTLRRMTTIFLFTEIAKADQEGSNPNPSDNASSSTHLKMSLKKIISAKETQIQLIKINANYSLPDAMKDVNTIVSDDAFVDQLPEDTEVAYEVTSDETDYDVNPCEDFSCEDTLAQMIYDSFQLSLQLKIIDMAGPYDMYGGPANSFGNLPFNIDCIISILTGSLVDMGCTSIPGFGLMTDEILLDSDTADPTFVLDQIDAYLQSLDLAYDCVSQGSKCKLEQHISQIEDTLRWLKQEWK